MQLPGPKTDSDPYSRDLLLDIEQQMPRGLNGRAEDEWRTVLSMGGKNAVDA